MVGEEQIYYLIGVSMFLGAMIIAPIAILMTNLYIRAWMLNRMNWKKTHWAVARVHTPSTLIREYIFNEDEEMVEIGERMYWPKKVGYVERKFNVPIYEFFEGETGGAQFTPSKLIFEDKEGKRGETVQLNLKTSTDKPISSSSIAASYKTYKAKLQAKLINKNANLLRNLLFVVIALIAIVGLLSYLSMTAGGEAKGVCQAAIQVLQHK